MIIEEVEPLIKQKNALIIKLDNSSNYNSEEEIKEDELLIGELQKQISEITYDKIKNIEKDIPKITKEFQLETVKDLRALHKKKYEEYRLLAKQCNELYKEIVKMKEKGRELGERLKAVNQDQYDLKETVSLIRRY